MFMMARRFTMPSPLSLYLFSFLSVSSALPWSGALPTLAYDAADWTPIPTTSPQPQNLKRDFFPHNVCGFIGGKANEPALCSASSSCVWDTVQSVVGCCPIDGPCTVGVYTGCVDKNSPSQTVADPAIFTCSAESVCYQNTYPGGYRQYGCGSSSGLATNVETTFPGQPTSMEVWVVSTSFFTTATLTSSETSAPSETTDLTTVVGEISSTLTTLVGEVSSGFLIVPPTPTTPVIPTFFPTSNATSSTSATSTTSIDLPSISTSSSSSIDASSIKSSTDINVPPPQVSSATETQTDQLSHPTIAEPSTFSNTNINPVGILPEPTASIASSSHSSGVSATGASAHSDTSKPSDPTPISTRNRNIVIGTTVGVGSAAILGIAGVVLFFLRRRRQKQEPSRGETELLTPMRPARSDDSFHIDFEYPLEDDVHSLTSPTQREPPTFPPPPNSENNAPAPNLFPFSSFPLPPTTLPSQQNSPARSVTIVSPLSREETRRNMHPLTTTFDEYPSPIREAISVTNSPKKYTPVPQDEDGAWREDSREVERIRKATRAPRFGESSNISGTVSSAPVMPGPQMVNMF